MELQISAQTEAIFRQKLLTGDYASEDELLRHALASLSEADDDWAAIEEGLTAIDHPETWMPLTSTVTLEEAQAKLPELIDHLASGEVLAITRNHQPIARLQAEVPPLRKPRKAGRAKGLLTILVEDDEHLAGFEEYMQ